MKSRMREGVRVVLKVGLSFSAPSFARVIQTVVLSSSSVSSSLSYHIALSLPSSRHIMVDDTGTRERERDENFFRDLPTFSTSNFGANITRQKSNNNKVASQDQRTASHFLPPLLIINLSVPSLLPSGHFIILFPYLPFPKQSRPRQSRNVNGRTPPCAPLFFSSKTSPSRFSESVKKFAKLYSR